MGRVTGARTMRDTPRNGAQEESRLHPLIAGVFIASVSAACWAMIIAVATSLF